jgi:hypothetical protein
LVTVIGIYIFIVLGFFAKKIFNEIDGKTLVILSTYFLQPFLTLWGIMLIPLDYNLIISPIAYLAAVFVSLFFTFLLALFLKDKKEKIIATLTPLIGNTGNLGIPLSYALFGDVGASIATMINLANIFFIYSFGVFFFASGQYSFKDAFVKIVKIPVMWFGIIALIINISGFTFNKDIMKILQMGAFASIVVQLLIFGIYVAEIKTREISLKLGMITTINKFVVFPLISFFILKLFGFKDMFLKVIMLEILTPLAVTNVNLSALFDLYPRKVAMLVILTSVMFLGVIFLIL